MHKANVTKDCFQVLFAFRVPSVSNRRMTEAEFKAVGRLHKMAQARETFREALETVRYIFEQNIDRFHPLFNALAESVVVLYARPFKKSQGIEELDKAMVPSGGLAIHETFLFLRDKLLAHTDKTAQIDSNFDIHTILIRRPPSGSGVLSVM